jgi:hypothetical protein
MNTQQLRTRLGRITRPEKLRNFWTLSHDAQYAARLALEELRECCLERARHIGVDLPNRDGGRVANSRVPARRMTDRERQILEGAGDLNDVPHISEAEEVEVIGTLGDDRHPDLTEDESFSKRDLDAPPKKKSERKLPKGMRFIRLKKKNVRQMTIDEILDLD